MKDYLYRHWMDSTLILAIVVTVVLLSFLASTPWYLFLIWLQFPVYLAHQFEEHVYPGHFKEFINREVFHSQDADAPLNYVAVFWINILAIWFLFPASAICAQNISPTYGVLLPVFGMFNATLHIIMFFVKRRYNPGFLVSTFINYPTGIYTLYILAQNHFLTATSLLGALTVTILAHAVIIAFVIKNLRGKNRPIYPSH